MKGHLKGKNTALTRKLSTLWGGKQYSKKEYSKLSKEDKNKIKEYLQNECFYFIKKIDKFDKVLAVEYLLIFLLRNPNLLNDKNKNA